MLIFSILLLVIAFLSVSALWPIIPENVIKFKMEKPSNPRVKHKAGSIITFVKKFQKPLQFRYKKQKQIHSDDTSNDNYISINLENKGKTVLIGLTFPVESYILHALQIKTLKPLAEYLLNHPEVKFRIEGHTDITGSHTSNRHLSLHRSQAVKDYLTDTCNIDENRLQAVGMGSSVPVSDGTWEGRRLNRRVEIHVV